MDYEIDEEKISLEFLELTRKCSLLPDAPRAKSEMKSLNRYSNIQPCTSDP